MKMRRFHRLAIGTLRNWHVAAGLGFVSLETFPHGVDDFAGNEAAAIVDLIGGIS